MKAEFCTTRDDLKKFIIRKGNEYNKCLSEGATTEKLKELTDAIGMLQEMVGFVLGEPMEHSLQIFYDTASTSEDIYSHYWDFATLDGKTIKFDIPMKEA